MKEYKWCAIDAEGDVGNKGLQGAAFYSDSLKGYITDHETIKAELLHHAREGYTFLAHNAQYDLSVLFWQLHIPIKAIYYNGRFNRGDWKYDESVPAAQLWDTLALSGGLSLAALGNALQIEKYPTPQRLLGKDPDKYEWQCEAHGIWECETCYAIRDAEIVYRFMTDLTGTLAAWGIKPARRINALAVNVWKQFDSPEPIKIKDPRIKRLGRKAYHGGRVETFKLGRISPAYAADVSSMYPSVMLDTPYPDPTTMVYFKDPALAVLDLTHEGVIECDVSVPNMHIPPLPYSDRGIIKYPIGRFRGFWTIAEIRYAVSLGCTVNRIFQLASTPKTLHPFNNFIQTLWEMRATFAASKDPRELFAKLLMNNLYGRLGASENMLQKVIYPLDKNKRLDEQQKSAWYTQDGELYLTYESQQGFGNDWSNVVWAAQTTAYARLKLHRYLALQGDAAIYCDTDSIFSAAPIHGIGTGLGALREDGTYQSMIVGAPKMYALQDFNGEWLAKVKGIRKDAALKFMREGTATYEQPIKPSSQGIRRIKAGTWVQITKESHHVPHRRQPLNPDALSTDYGCSDTVPPVIGRVP